MSQQQLWIKGAILLTIAGFLSKVLGMFYRVPLQNITGDEGLYIYQQIYPILSIAILLSLYSLPGAIAHVITRQQKSNASIRIPNEWVVFSLLFVLGSLIFLCLSFSSNLIANLMGDPKLSSSLRVASGMFVLIPITATLRGLLQSMSLTRYVAASQIIEQFVRVILIILFTIYLGWWIDATIYQIGIYAAWATIIGTVITSLYLVLIYYRKSRHIPLDKVPWNYGIIKIFFYGILIYSLNYMLHLVLQLVDVFTMVELLVEYGYAFEEAKIIKGTFDRSHSLIQLGLVIGSSLALALIPTLNQNKSQQALAIKTTWLLSISSAVGLMAILSLLNPLLFKNNQQYMSIHWMMLLIFILSIAVVLSVLLQKEGYQIEQVKWILLMVLIKYVSNLILIPQFGTIGSSLSYIIAAGLLCLVFWWKWIERSGLLITIGFVLRSIVLVVSMYWIVTMVKLETMGFIHSNKRWILLFYVLGLCLLGAIVVGLGVYGLKLLNKQERKQLIGQLERG